jgi:hypothetical protein
MRLTDNSTAAAALFAIPSTTGWYKEARLRLRRRLVGLLGARDLPFLALRRCQDQGRGHDEEKRVRSLSKLRPPRRQELAPSWPQPPTGGTDTTGGWLADDPRAPGWCRSAHAGFDVQERGIKYTGAIPRVHGVLDHRAGGRD